MTSLPLTEAFIIVEWPQSGVTYRGVEFTPVPEAASFAVLGAGLAGRLATRRRDRPVR